MNNTIRVVLYLTVLLLLVDYVTAVCSALPSVPQMSEVVDLNTQLNFLASALGVLVMTYAGIRWIMSDGPQERDDAKKYLGHYHRRCAHGYHPA